MAWDEIKKIKLTIDHTKIDGNLTDFPIVVTIASGVGITNYDTFKVFDELTYANRKRLAFFAGGDQTGGQQCYTEIEYWNQGVEAALHVQVPSVSSSADTVLYFYYDSAQSENTDYVGDVLSPAAKAVWDSDFEAVYHMAQDPSGGSNSIKDSTSNSNHGTPGGTMLGEDLVDGKIGECLDFDGSNDNIDLGNIQDGATAFTWELVVSSTQSIDDGNYYQLPVMLGTYQASGSSGDALFCVKAGDIAWYDEIGGGGIDTNNSISDGNWYHVVVTRNGTVLKIYKNGGLINTYATGAAGINSLGLNICGAHWTSNRYFGGLVDEVRISNIARPPEWVKATYNSNFDSLVTYETPNFYYFDGYVKEEGTPVVRTVRGHRHDTGTVVFETTSSGIGGYFYGETTYSGTHYVIAFDDAAGATYNALILDNVVPSIIEQGD